MFERIQRGKVDDSFLKDRGKDAGGTATDSQGCSATIDDIC